MTRLRKMFEMIDYLLKTYNRSRIDHPIWLNCGTKLEIVQLGRIRICREMPYGAFTPEWIQRDRAKRSSKAQMSSSATADSPPLSPSLGLYASIWWLRRPFTTCWQWTTASTAASYYTTSKAQEYYTQTTPQPMQLLHRGSEMLLSTTHHRRLTAPRHTQLPATTKRIQNIWTSRLQSTTPRPRLISLAKRPSKEMEGYHWWQQ